MDTPNNQPPSVARAVIWLLAFFAGAAGCAWDFYAKPGGWIEGVVSAYVLTFMFGTTIWGLVSTLKVERRKQLAERARLKAFNDANQLRRSIEDHGNTAAQ